MDTTITITKKQRRPKAELESKSFKDGAIYLFKRADYKKPTWFCRVKVPNSKGYVSCSTKTTDEHQAYAFANTLFNDTYLKVAQGHEINSKRVSTAIIEYEKGVANFDREKTTVKTRLNFLKHCSLFFADTRLKDLKTENIQDLSKWLIEHSRSGHLAANTIKRYQADLKFFLNWCLERSYLDSIPRFPKMRIEDNRRPHFDNRDWARLTRQIREFVKSPIGKVARDRTLLVNYVLILANTGVRVGEARLLKWRDLRAIPASKDSDQPPDIALFVKGKTGPREVVARTSDVTIYFKRILELRAAELGRKPSNDDYVFCNRDGTPIASFKKSFSSLLKFARVETDSYGAKRTIYSLRHTYATFRLQEGVHHFILAKNMGTSVEMLERHYGHTTNVSSAAELTKSGSFRSGRSAKAVDWLLEP